MLRIPGFLYTLWTCLWTAKQDKDLCHGLSGLGCQSVIQVVGTSLAALRRLVTCPRTVEDGWHQLNDTRWCKVKSKQGLKEAGEEVSIFYLTHHCIESGIKMIFICQWKFVLQFHAENFCNGAGSFGERQCGIRWWHLLIRPVKCAQRWNRVLWCSVVGRGHLTFCSYICKHILREKFGWMSGEHYKRLELDKSLSSLPALRVTEWNGGVQPCLLRSKADL